MADLESDNAFRDAQGTRMVLQYANGMLRQNKQVNLSDIVTGKAYEDGK